MAVGEALVQSGWGAASIILFACSCTVAGFAALASKEKSGQKLLDMVEVELPNLGSQKFAMLEEAME